MMGTLERAVSFEYLHHTADLKAEVRGPSFLELTNEAVRLLRDILVGSSPVGETCMRSLGIGSGDDGERFFRLVRELLFLYDSEGFLPARIRFPEPEEDGIMVAIGEIFDDTRHRAERQVKALTRHDYVFKRGPSGYHAVLLFDL
jgi:SHS2 domain-containing protein